MVTAAKKHIRSVALYERRKTNLLNLFFSKIAFWAML